MVRVLALGDPHGKLPVGLTKIIKKNKIELIICVGDIAYAPEKPWLDESWKGMKEDYPEKTYKRIVDKICSYGLPVLTLRGNMFMRGEYKQVADKIFEPHKNLINKFTGFHEIVREKFVFFDVLWEKSGTRKKTITKAAKERNERRKKKLSRILKKGDVLISHNPPYGCCDFANNEFTKYKNKHVGSKIVRDAIKKKKPKLVLCGHIHEGKSKGRIGKTVVINCGERGDYVVLDISEKVRIVESNFLKK